VLPGKFFLKTPLVMVKTHTVPLVFPLIRSFAVPPVTLPFCLTS